MWNKLKIRTKITIVSSIILFVISVVFAATLLIAFKSIVFQPLQTIIVESNQSSANINVNESFVANTTDVIKTNNSFYYLIIIVVLILLIVNIIGTLLIYWMCKRLLKPLEHFTRQISSINSNNLNNTFILPNKNDEVYALSDAFNKMLVELDSSFNSQRNFSINVAHELKTPITTMKTNIDVLALKENPSIEDYQLIIERITRSNERLKNLVSSLLEIQNNNLRYEETKINEMLDKIKISLSNDYNKEHNINVYGNLSLETDYYSLERIFHNIIENSLKYSSDIPIIDIYLSDKDIVIKDNGIGIAEDKISLITQPFYCIDQSRSKEYGGYGLGLSIVKEYCARLDYNFLIESELGKGTTITIIH